MVHEIVIDDIAASLQRATVQFAENKRWPERRTIPGRADSRAGLCGSRRER